MSLFRNSDMRDYLTTRRSAIDRALEGCLKGYKSHAHSLWRAMHYSLFPGGKRIRPILTLAAGELFGGKHKVLLPFACAFEMIHTYSIVHDDLPAIDDDDLRRGLPTTHKVFGEGIALLAGDALLTEAFHLMSAPRLARALPAKLLVELLHEVSDAVGASGLVGGQAFDVEAEDKEVDVATVEYIHVRKTGALIVTAARVGARLARAKPGDLKKISRYAEFLGLAFQIADDILDAHGEPSESGRSESGFKERKKPTYPSVVGLTEAKSRVRELLRRCVKELDSFGPAADPLREIARQAVGRALRENNNKEG